MDDLRKLLKIIFCEALKAVDSYNSVKKYLDRIYSAYKNGRYKKLVTIGFGKASCPMARAIEDGLMDLVNKGSIITKYGHCDNKYLPKKIKAYEAGHPIPDTNGLLSTQEIVKMIKDSGEETLVVCLISGGGSALFVSPYDGLNIDEKRKVTDLLLKAGADIFELNSVRKHLSRVKGGRLAEIAYPSKLITLILSDVIGDKLDVIASGPTAPDTSTYMDAIRVLEKYELYQNIPQNVMKILKRGVEGLIPETPKEGNVIFRGVENIIIGSNKKATEHARLKAESLGFHTEIISTEITGEAKDTGKWLAQMSLEVQKSEHRGYEKKMCLISGGETTVTVRGDGKGGRNTELALSFAMGIDGKKGVTFLSAGTDGTDGPTDAAGAIVDGSSIEKGRSLGLEPEEYLRNNDSYTFFKKTGDIFITGPTGINVMDLQIMVVE